MTIQSNPSPEEVLESHNFDEQLVPRFCNKLTNVPPEVETQVLSVINDDEVQDWLRDPESSILILSGGRDPHQIVQEVRDHDGTPLEPYDNWQPPVSVVSFVSAKLVQQHMLNREDVIPLVFFGTMQRSHYKGRLIPIDLAKDLFMLQLIYRCCTRFRGVLQSIMMHNCIYHAKTVFEVCVRFTELVLSIDTTSPLTIFIVIDGSHELEMARDKDEDKLGKEDRFHPEYERMFDHLLTFFYRPKSKAVDEPPKPTLKLLLAGPSGSRYVEQLEKVPRTRIVDVPLETVAAIESSGWAYKVIE